VIANRIKPILLIDLLAEQLGFLEGRQIHDAIGTSHECIHSIKKKILKAVILKLDLQKAYNSISWDFLRMVLRQIGFGLQLTNWIMSCVNTTSFAVLVNGEASKFFKSGRVLRQGCPLSPLLFILVMESLSLLLKSIQQEGIIKGIKVSRVIKILHILFVDDILILANATVKEWKEVERLVQLFCSVTRLLINHLKSIVHFSGLLDQEVQSFK
jgi:hypothetical protein